MIRTVFGSNKSGTAYWAANTALGTIYRGFGVSTRNGNLVVDWGDGAIQNITPVKNVDATLSGVGGVPNLTQLDHTYTSYNGNIALKFLQGLKDVYSISIGGNPFYLNQTWQSFIGQFNNLYSVYIDQPHNGSSYINGDVAIMPDSVERFVIADLINSASLNLNLSNFSSTSKLKFFNISGGQYDHNQFGIITGDLAKIPAGVSFFKLYYAKVGSAITYTAGKVWASSFDTLYLPIPLTASENDNLLIDAYNSVTTAIGGKLWDLKGFRTHASDVAVSGLISKGFTVICVTQQNYIDSTTGLVFRMDLQNNFDTYGNSIVQIIAGNANGLPSFVSDGSGGYALDFTGTKSIKTSINLPLSASDKVSIEFDIKTTATSIGCVIELSPSFSSFNAFGVFINDLLTNKIELLDNNSDQNYITSPTTVNTGNWINVKMVIDRALGVNQSKIYINGILSTQPGPQYKDVNGNYGAYTLFIGQRAGSSLSFVGQMKNLKIYNYPIL